MSLNTQLTSTGKCHSQPPPRQNHVIFLATVCFRPMRHSCLRFHLPEHAEWYMYDACIRTKRESVTRGNMTASIFLPLLFLWERQIMDEWEMELLPLSQYSNKDVKNRLALFGMRLHFWSNNYEDWTKSVSTNIPSSGNKTNQSMTMGPHAP